MYFQLTQALLCTWPGAYQFTAYICPKKIKSAGRDKKGVHTQRPQDIGELADTLEQLPVGDLQLIPWFIALPEDQDTAIVNHLLSTG